MSRCLVLTGFLAACAQGFAPVSILWGESTARSYVLKPKVSLNKAVFRMIGLHSNLAVSEWQPYGAALNEIPYFRWNADKTMTWRDTGLCVEATKHQRREAVRFGRCNGGPAQKWDCSLDGHGRHVIRLQDTRKCLTIVNEAGVLNGALVELHECDHAETISWKLEPIPFPTDRSGPDGLSFHLRKQWFSFVALFLLGLFFLHRLVSWWQPNSRVVPAGPGTALSLNQEGSISLTMPLRCVEPNASSGHASIMHDLSDAKKSAPSYPLPSPTHRGYVATPNVKAADIPDSSVPRTQGIRGSEASSDFAGGHRHRTVAPSMVATTLGLNLEEVAPALPTAHAPPRVQSARFKMSMSASAKSDRESKLFDTLLSTYGVQSAISLDGARSGNGRGVVAKRFVDTGESLLVVPNELLLTAHRSGVVGGLIGQTDPMMDAAGDLREEVGAEKFKQGLTWDVRLALAVFEATAGCGGSFWDEYRKLLPLPPFLATTVCLPASLLAQLQDPVLEQMTCAKKDLFSSSFPTLDAHSVHPTTAGYAQIGAPLQMIPVPLLWAYALGVSRSFAMRDGDTFAMVPFLDMAQHSENPSANFVCTADGRFELSALRPIAPGEAVTISYVTPGVYNSRRMFELYGFVVEDGTARDADLLVEAVAAHAKETGAMRPSSSDEISTTEIKPLLNAFDAHREAEYSSEARLAALFDALSAPGAPPPATLLESIQWQIKKWPSSLDEDLEEMRQLQDSSEQGVDARFAAVLSYRIGRKKLFALAEAVLSTFLDVERPPS